MKIRAKLAVLSVSTALFLSGCAHAYHYTAEVAGDGAMFAKYGVIYSIPPSTASGTDSPRVLLKMKLTSLGVKDRTMLVRMYFLRKEKAKTVGLEYLDPKEQTLILPDNKMEIHPSRVFASAVKKPLVVLSARDKQAVEFEFPVGDKKDEDIQHFILRWKIHYTPTKVEAQTARFDRDDRAPQQGAEMFPGDPDYPLDESPLWPAGSEWIPDDWAWWGM